MALFLNRFPGRVSMEVIYRKHWCLNTKHVRHSSIQLYRFAVYIFFVHAEILRHTCFILCSNIDIESVCICIYIYIYFYVCILYTYMFYILWIFVFENHDGFRHSVADWSQIGEPQTATLVVAGASLPSNIYIYNTYWYKMYAYIWIHIHEFQRGKSLQQKPREPTKNAMPIVRESWGHVLIIPMKCLNQLLLWL